MRNLLCLSLLLLALDGLGQGIRPALLGASRTVPAAGGGSPTVTKIAEWQLLNTTSISATTTVSAAAGGIVVAIIGGAGGSTTAATMASGGDTWVMSTNAADAGNGTAILAYHTILGSTMASGTVITASALQQVGWSMFVYYVANTTAIDQWANKSPNSYINAGDPHPTGTTASITGSNDAAIAVWQSYGASRTWTSTWSGDNALDTYTLDTRSGMIRWKSVTSGTQSATATYIDAGASAAFIIVFK